MRLTTLLALALIALAPTSAVAATPSKPAPVAKNCISLPEMEKAIEDVKASIPGQIVIVRTRKADEVARMATEANKVEGQTIDVPKQVEVILIRSDARSILIFAQKDKSCNLIGGPTPAVMELISNALGEKS